MNTKRAMVTCAWVMLLIFSSGAASSAPAAKTKRLTFEQAYLRQEPQLLKSLREASGWFDAEHYLRQDQDEKTKAQRLFKMSAKTGEAVLLLDYGQIQKDCPAGLKADVSLDHTPDYRGLLYRHDKDLFYYSVPDRNLRRLTHDAEAEETPSFSPDGKLVAFTRTNDLWAVDIESGREIRLTADESETILNGRASWVYFEEIQDRSYRAFWWSPDSRRLSFLRFDNGRVPVFPLFRSGGTHGELELTRYPKAGDPNPKVKAGVVSVADSKIVWADFDENADHYVAWPLWLPDASGLTVQWMNRAQDQVKIFAIDPATGKTTEIYEEKQAAWVEFFPDLYFFKDRSGFLLRTDRSRWSHLYHFDLKGRLKRQLTDGEWSVRKIILVDEGNGTVYFTASPDPTTETHLYRVRLSGSKPEKLTKEPGTHAVHVAPSGAYFLDTHSSVNTPNRQDLWTTKSVLVRNIDDARTPLMDEYALGKTELFSIPTDDGWNLPAVWILPPDFNPAKKYPVLFSIYGGPYMLEQWHSTVSNSFPSMRSFFLAQEGLIWISVDHRGSGHYGKKGASLMHRRLGQQELQDLIQAVKWLRSKPFVDAERIGITGGSYGGYMTCYALTAGADFFTHGLAGSSVTDWRLYDSVYTERFMDTPSENPEGYRMGSVITHVPQMKGLLFLDHGDLDDNVHMQNSIQLINALMDADKSFEFMLYPNQRHGYGAKKREFASRTAYGFWKKQLLGR